MKPNARAFVRRSEKKNPKEKITSVGQRNAARKNLSTFLYIYDVTCPGVPAIHLRPINA